VRLGRIVKNRQEALKTAAMQKKAKEEEANRVQAIAAAVDRGKKEQRLAKKAQAAALKKKLPTVITAARKKPNQTLGRNPVKAVAALPQPNGQPEVEEKFICEIHRHGSVDLEMLQNVKAYLKPGASYELTTLLTSSHCHSCSKHVTEEDCAIYYCMRCKNEMCYDLNIANDELSGGDVRTLPWLCGPCFVAGVEHAGKGKKSTRKRKPTSKAQESC
jgi:hypothetical protein